MYCVGLRIGVAKHLLKWINRPKAV